MARYSTEQYKAIGHHANKNNLTPQLSVYPIVRFSKKGSDEIIERHVSGLVTEYKNDKKEETAEKLRTKREEERQSKMRNPFKDQYQ